MGEVVDDVVAAVLAEVSRPDAVVTAADSPVDVNALLEALTDGLDAHMATSSSEGLLVAGRLLELAGSWVALLSGRVGAELATRRVTTLEFGQSAEAWLAQSPGCARVSLRHRLAVARALRDHFGLFEAAIAEGRLGFEHAVVLVRVCNPRIRQGLIDAQGTLITLAEECHFEFWANSLRVIANRLDLDGGHDPNRDRAANRLHLHPDGVGVVVKGALVGDAAMVARETIDSLADELAERHRRDAELDESIRVPTRAQLRAEALVELCRRATAVDLRSSAPARPLVTLVIHSDDPSVTAYTPHGGAYPTDLLDRLGDADLAPLVLSSTGVPLHYGRTRRLATPAQRRAIAARDGGCVFPGCDMPSAWCQNHHVAQWGRDHGPTDAWNLPPLCWQHHGLTHTDGWAMHAHTDQTYTWTTPTGRTLYSQRHGRIVHPDGDGLPPEVAPTHGPGAPPGQGTADAAADRDPGAPPGAADAA